MSSDDTYVKIVNFFMGGVDFGTSFTPSIIENKKGQPYLRNWVQIYVRMLKLVSLSQDKWSNTDKMLYLEWTYQIWVSNIYREYNEVDM